MLRPTKTEINEAIVDQAAGLFAKYEFARTSIQQIADAVGYSKAGLLHHFPSKQAIYDAAIRTISDHLRQIVKQAERLRPGMDRDEAVVEASVDFAYRKPGISALSNRMALSPDPSDKHWAAIGLLLFEALGNDPDSVDTDRLIRVSCAFTGLGIATSLAVNSGRMDEWRGAIIATTMNALGHKL